MTRRMSCDGETLQPKEEKVKFNQNMFYGRNKTATLPIDIRIKRRLRDIRRKQTPRAYKSRLTGPCSSWKIFHRQKDAFDFVSSSSQELRVWSYESDAFVENHGQRLYLAASPHQFWHYYSQLDPFQRHHYEVIPEGDVCRLYFDLEYNTELNPALDGPRMVQIFIQFVCYQLKRIHGVSCSKEDVLQLDASISTKFSQHLVFCTDKFAFKDNSHAGGFVEHVCTVIEEISAHASQPPTNLPDPQTVSDPATRHREATLNNNVQHAAGSAHSNADSPTESSSSCPLLQNNDTKASSSRSLGGELLDNQSPGLGVLGDRLPSRDDCLQMLEESCLSADDIDSLFAQDKQGKRVIFCDRGVYTKNRNFRLYMSCKLGKANPLVVAPTNTYCRSRGAAEQDQIFLDSLVCSARRDDSVRLLSWEGRNPSRSQRSPSSQHHAGISNQASAEGFSSRSPYSEVDAFVTSVISSGGRRGNIRRWSYFQEAELLIYDIVGNRWCHNIGREHRSNNVMIVVDLQRGVYYQKCHDPDCKATNYKSPDWPLPTHVLPSHILQDDEDFQEPSYKPLSGDVDDALSDDVLRHLDINPMDVRESVKDNDADVWDPLSYDDVLVTESLLENEAEDAVLAEAAAAVDNVQENNAFVSRQDFDEEEMESDLVAALETYEKSFSEDETESDLLTALDTYEKSVSKK